MPIGCDSRGPINVRASQPFHEAPLDRVSFDGYPVLDMRPRSLDTEGQTPLSKAPDIVRDLVERFEPWTEHDKRVVERQIKATDDEIDRLVYDLYGLTEEEIKIAEEATA